ncbi:MAG: nitroreductase family protein, partial [Chitinispirillaceae bacterium]|nr:nitroreductase family protein [Chitinispirillaceae bacterium]
MDFLELVKKRRSVRSYLDRPVDDALLEKVLEAGRLAPSACNNQPWVFIVIREMSSKKNLENVYRREWFLRAPVVIAVCCDRSVSWKSADGRDSGAIDAAIALDHMTLAAAEAGLGTCWICAFNSSEARKTLMLPETIDPVAFTPLGFPGPEEPKPKTRKRLND